MQLEKRDFKKKKEDDDVVYVHHALQNPLSPYQIMAGTVIPGVMITGINSELPGQIIGQVRENVYDTVTGNYLLIPQGTKIIGRYDSVIAYGQERVLIVWNRLIMPDGSSLIIDRMPGTDLGGYSGLKDKVNNHYLKLTAGVILSTLLSLGASVSAGTPGYNDDDNGYDITNRFAENAGESINKAGQKIIGKMLNIQPTLEIRPGFTFNVMVNRDIVVRPYKGIKERR
jgi:type IV secretion system protein VirB10